MHTFHKMFCYVYL